MPRLLLAALLAAFQMPALYAAPTIVRDLVRGDPCAAISCSTIYSDGTLELRTGFEDTNARDATMIRMGQGYGWTRFPGFAARAAVKGEDGILYIAGDIGVRLAGRDETTYAAVYRLKRTRGELDLDQVGAYCGSMLIRVERLSAMKGGVALTMRDYGNWDARFSRNGRSSALRTTWIAGDTMPMLIDPCRPPVRR